MKEININIKSKRAFTLIELIVVIAVLALLAAVAVPMISSWVEKAGESERAANARTIELLVKSFMAEKGLTELPNPDDDVSNWGTLTDLYLDYLLPIMSAANEVSDVSSRLNKPGTGVYIVDKYGNVTVDKADPKADPKEEGLVTLNFD